MLTVPLGALRAVLTTTFDEIDGLWAFDLVKNLCLNGSAINGRRANLGTYHQNFVELNGFTRLGGQLLNTQYVARLYLVLLATCFQDRKHPVFPSRFPRPVALPIDSVRAVSGASNSAPRWGVIT